MWKKLIDSSLYGWFFLLWLVFPLLVFPYLVWSNEKHLQHIIDILFLHCFSQVATNFTLLQKLLLYYSYSHVFPETQRKKYLWKLWKIN